MYIKSRRPEEQIKLNMHFLLRTSFIVFIFVALLQSSFALELKVWSPSAVTVGHPSVEIGCEYLRSTDIDVRITSIEWQKEWPRGTGVFQTIAIFYPPDGGNPSFSQSIVATQIKDRTILIKPTNESMTAKLIIDDIECEDHGKYKCSVQFDSSSGSGTVDKIVLMRTVAEGKAPYAVPVPSTSGGLIENERVEFTCKADVGKPAGKIHWWLFRANKTTPQDLTDNAIQTPSPVRNPGICDTNVVSTLPFDVHKDDHNGKIRCSVDQELLTSPTGKLSDMPYKETDRFRVFYPVRKPEITKTPDEAEYDISTPSISIKCSTIGNPNPFRTNDDEKAKVTWYFKKSQDSVEIYAIRIPNIEITKRELRLTNLKESQAGIYVCEVQNSFKGETYMQRTEVPIKIIDPDNPGTVSDIAVSIGGDSVILIFLIGIFFLIYKQGRRSLKKGKYESYPGLEMKVSTMDNTYADTEEFTNKENEAKEKV